jgi:hypothetical protein
MIQTLYKHYKYCVFSPVADPFTLESVWQCENIVQIVYNMQNDVYLFIYCFTSPSKMFHLFRDVTTAGVKWSVLMFSVWKEAELPT